MNYLRAVTWWTLISWSSLSACASSAPGGSSASTTTPVEVRNKTLPAVHKRGAQKLIVEVGTAGGTLELDNGARLVIPEGALAQNVEITFSEGARTTAFSNHEYEKPLGPTIEISPEVELASPVRLSIPLKQLPDGFEEKDLAMGLEVVSSTQRAVQGYGVQTRWDYLTASAEGGRAVADLEQIPGYRVQFVVSKSE
jgi:hypothetical protein